MKNAATRAAATSAATEPRVTAVISSGEKEAGLVSWMVSSWFCCSGNVLCPSSIYPWYAWRVRVEPSGVLCWVDDHENVVEDVCVCYSISSWLFNSTLNTKFYKSAYC